MRQSNVLRLCCRHRDLSLKLDILYDWSASVQYGVAGPRLGGASIVAGGRTIPGTTKVGIGVHLKPLVTSGVQRDYLRLFCLEKIY